MKFSYLPKPSPDWEAMFGTVDQSTHTPSDNLSPIPDASSGDGILRTTDQCLEWAQRLGCDVFEASASELFVDLDTEFQYQQFLSTIRLLNRHIYIQDVIITPSKQGLPHRHARIQMNKELPLLARIALQAALSSNPNREILSVIRALNQESNIILFFEKGQA